MKNHNVGEKEKATMDKLSTSILTHIYGHLTVRDMVQASMVCRKWCVSLWREEEQTAVWHQRVLLELLLNKIAVEACTASVLKECFIRRELPHKTPEEVAHFARTVLPAKRLRQMEMVSKSLCVLPHARRAILGTWLLQSKQENLIKKLVGHEEENFAETHIFAPTFSTEHLCAAYRFRDGEFMCLHGLFDRQQRLLDGAFIKNGEVLYSGEFAGGRPNGQGIMYFQGVPHVQGNFHNGVPHGFARFFSTQGVVKYEGEWKNGKQHGQGTEYYDNGAEKKFQGTYADGYQEHGVWYNADGSLVHFGNRASFDELLNEALRQHRCSFTVTKECHAKQDWWNCETCFGNDTNMGVCFACAGNCHKGHKLTNMKRNSPFFCDCGAGTAPMPCQALIGCGGLIESVSWWLFAACHALR